MSADVPLRNCALTRPWGCSVRVVIVREGVVDGRDWGTPMSAAECWTAHGSCHATSALAHAPTSCSLSLTHPLSRSLSLSLLETSTPTRTRTSDVNYPPPCRVIAKFHYTDTDTDFFAAKLRWVRAGPFGSVSVSV